VTPNRPAAVKHVIVFDLDDTLYLERDYVLSGFAAVGRWVEAHLSLKDFSEAARRHFDAGLRERVFDAVLSELGAAAEPSLIARLVQIYREHEPTIALAKDAADFLDSVREDVGIALLTDGHLVSQTNKIRALGLEERKVWPIVCTDQWGRDYWKPHRRGFELIQSTFELPADAFSYVADNPTKDFVAPRQLGWRTVQILRPQRVHSEMGAQAEHPADISIASLDEFELPQRRSTPG